MHGRVVYINGRFLEQRVTGVQRFATEMLTAIDDLLEVESAPSAASFVVLAPRGARVLPLKHVAVSLVGPLHGHAWEQCTLPAVAGNAPLLGFGPTGPLAKRNQVVTIHDAGVRVMPRSYGWRFRAAYEILLPALVDRSPFVMTVSEFSKQQLIYHYGARCDRVHVSGEGWEHMLRITPDDRILERHALAPRRYLLAVSSLTRSKNFGIIAKALERLPMGADVQVAVAGAVDGRSFASAPTPRAASMRWLGYVSDGELRSLYANAAAFIFPSLYEGFGLPPLEAMALDCPVVSSTAASLPEVCGDAALYFDPFDADALAEVMLRVVSDRDERERLIDRGRKRLHRYSWRRAARAYLSLVGDWMEGAGPDGPVRRRHLVFTESLTSF